MLSKSMYRFIKERFKYSSNLELSNIHDQLRELIRSPLSSVDEDFLMDAKKLITQVEAEINLRSEHALIEKLDLQEIMTSPAKPHLHSVR